MTREWAIAGGIALLAMTSPVSNDPMATKYNGMPDDNHYSTCRDLALLAQRMITDFPEHYHYYSEMEFKYHGIKQGAGLDTWRGMDYQTVLTPAEYKTGNVIYPYEKAK